LGGPDVTSEIPKKRRRCDGSPAAKRAALGGTTLIAM